MRVGKRLHLRRITQFAARRVRQHALPLLTQRMNGLLSHLQVAQHHDLHARTLDIIDEGQKLPPQLGQFEPHIDRCAYRCHRGWFHAALHDASNDRPQQRGLHAPRVSPDRPDLTTAGSPFNPYVVHGGGAMTYADMSDGFPAASSTHRV